MRGEQAIFNLEIKKKSGLSINPDIHHSKVFSSGYISSNKIEQRGLLFRLTLIRAVILWHRNNYQRKFYLLFHFVIVRICFS